MIAKIKLIILRLISCKTRPVRILRRTGLGLFLVLVFLVVFSYTRAGMYTRTYTHEAQAATSSTLNFQGRLSNASGSIVSDGTYSIEYKLYNVSSGGTAQWTETQGTVSIRNGYFSVRLGSITSFPGTIDWSQEQWLTMNVNGDGEMTPRLKLTAVPYAFRAGQADSLTNGSGVLSASDILQKAPVTIQSLNSSIAGLRLNQTGSGGLLQLQGDGSDVFTVDKLGAATLSSSITLGNTSSTIPGTIRWNGTDLQGYTSSGWLSLTAGSGVTNPFRSVTKSANEAISSTVALQDDDELFFSIGANETWNFRFVVQGNSGTAPDFRFAVSGPTGATCHVAYSDPEGATGGGQYGCGVTTASVPGSGAAELYEITGSITNGANAGDVRLRWAQFTSNAANTTVYAGSYVEAQRAVGGGLAQAFIQGGNSFSEKAVLGTNDNNDIGLLTNGNERLTILSNGNIGIGDSTPSALLTVGTGDALQVTSAGNLSTTGTVDIGGLTTLTDSLIASNSASGLTATSAATPGSNTTTVNLAGAAFANNDVIYINNAGQDYFTRIISGGGTATLTVSPAVSYDASAPIEKYNIQNIGATDSDYSNLANRFFQGYFLGGIVVGAGSTTLSDGNLISTGNIQLRANGGSGNVSIDGNLGFTGILSGDGSGLTNISASSISGGTLSDSQLSSNVALLDNIQTFTGQKTFSSGVIISAGGLSIVGGLDNNSSGITEVGGLSGVTNLSLNGSISGGTTISGSGNINTSGGAIQTAGLTRIDNAGNLNNIGDITGTAALTLASGGSSNLTLNSASNTIVIDGTDTSLQRIASGTLSFDLSDSGATVLSLTNSGAGLANLNINEGSLFTAGVSRLTNGGNLQNITGITSSGSITFSSLNSGGLVKTDGSGMLSSAVAGTDYENPLTFGDGLTRVTNTVNIGGSLSSSKDINLGTHIFSFSGNGSVAIGSTSASGRLSITDSSSSDSLFANKTGASGNILTLQKGGNGVFTIANNGATQISTDSTTALQVRNAAGSSNFFTVDTSGSIIQVGSSTGDASGVLFVLDSKTGTNPTGVAGAQYYNSTDSKFRCFEGGAWKDCTGNYIRSFIDTTSDTVVDSNTTNYWDAAAENNNTSPNIVLSQASGKSVMGMVTMEMTPTSNADTEVTARVERGIGSVPTCGSGTQVGGQPGVFSTNNGANKASTITFIDNPNTASTVYYILCSDNSTVGTAGNITRIRITLQEVQNSN
ncbi:MAG: hypothetical protein U0451_02590 [Candidatus Saccharimonadales bacterium]